MQWASGDPPVTDDSIDFEEQTIELDHDVPQSMASFTTWSQYSEYMSIRFPEIANYLDFDESQETISVIALGSGSCSGLPSVVRVIRTRYDYGDNSEPDKFSSTRVVIEQASYDADRCAIADHTSLIFVSFKRRNDSIGTDLSVYSLENGG